MFVRKNIEQMIWSEAYVVTICINCHCHTHVEKAYVERSRTEGADQKTLSGIYNKVSTCLSQLRSENI